MDKYIMVDLETLSLNPTPFIASIGAVSFTKEGIHDEFYEIMGLDIQPHADISMATLSWWMRQGEGSRSEILPKDGRTLHKVLEEFSEFVYEVNPRKIFSNGATSDLVWLKNAYYANDLPVPWEYYQEACYRTVRDLAQVPEHREEDQMHHALMDAKHQAEVLITAAKTYSLGL